MKPSSAPPWPSSAPSTLLLQRRLCIGDCGKWKTMLKFSPRRMNEAHALALLARALDPTTEWRIAKDSDHG